MTCRLSEVISPVFAPVHRQIAAGGITEVVCKGGRGSAKSSFVSVEIPLQLIKHPDCHAVVLRKVGNTIRTSVYAQMRWAIETLGLGRYFRCTVSPLEMTYQPTGQKILFFGMDDPGKLKSLKLPFGYPGILWFEELDQFAGPEEVRNVEQSVLRGGEWSLEFRTFNPPISASNWANEYCLKDKPGQLIHHSTYLTTPKEWLGERFLNDAAHLQEVNPRAYAHEYMGEAVGTGGQVFERLELRAIPDDELARFDRIYQGNDWGWYPDPLAFVRLHYDRAKDTIYLIDEIYANKLPNRSAAEIIRERGYTDTYITCDIEHKSIVDYRECGLPARAAVKGPGSVDYGMKWLQNRTIVIDPKRTPNAAREFLHYEYERDREGRIISGYPDCDNHTIDAVRYALEQVFMRRGNPA